MKNRKVVIIQRKLLNGTGLNIHEANFDLIFLEYKKNSAAFASANFKYII